MSEYALKIIATEEGFEPRPYLCSEGYPTVGYGQKIGKKDADLKMFDFEMPEVVASVWMQQNIDSMLDKMESDDDIAAALESCNEVRESVLISMAYQMGVTGLSNFKNMLTAVELGDFDEAANQALDSRWARQTPERADRHAEMLRTGEILPYYS